MIIFEFYGAPGSGKSVLSGYLYSKFGREGKNSALVTEFTKPWAERKHSFCDLDHLGIQGGQSRMELDKIKAGYDYIFTDCPLHLVAFYAGDHGNNPLEWSLVAVANTWQKSTDKQYNIKRERFFIPFNPERHINNGRIHSVDESIRIDSDLRSFLEDWHIEYRTWDESMVETL